MSFETDEPADFLDLVMELREAKTSLYTLRDTPIFSCIAMNLREALDQLDGASVVTNAGVQPSKNGVGWTPVASVKEVPDGRAKAVYVGGEQIALFNVSGNLYAVGNRCSHANASLADGAVEGTSVTCPNHGSRFDLQTGEPLSGPASRPVPRFDVRVEDGLIYVAAAKTDQPDAVSL